MKAKSRPNWKKKETKLNRSPSAYTPAGDVAVFADSQVREIRHYSKES